MDLEDIRHKMGWDYWNDEPDTKELEDFDTWLVLRDREVAAKALWSAAKMLDAYDGMITVEAVREALMTRGVRVHMGKPVL